MRFLIFCPASHGGIAEHAHYQAQALVQRQLLDFDLVLLCSADFLKGRIGGYKKSEIFHSHFSFFNRFLGRFGKMLDRCLKISCEQWMFAWDILRRKPDLVLVASYSEYLAPFWIWPHLIFARFFGVTYVANLHDPIRDYQVGSKWWHDLSVKLAYLPISIGVVHQRLSPHSPVPSHVKVVEAPVGVYDLQESPESPDAIRAAWGVGNRKLENAISDSLITSASGPASLPAREPQPLALDSCLSTLDNSAPADVVFLAFGFIRDNKNLDLVIRALADIPSAVLVVMGRAQSKKDKPLEFYRNLAMDLCVLDRVKFFDGFVPDEKLASYFAAADVVVITYDGTFHSQSGVLNVAARARRRVLASAGESPLKDSVQLYNLGVFVEPDSAEAIARAMKKMASPEWRRESGEPDWEGYEAFASWDVNVKMILDAVKEVRGQ